MGKGRFVTLLAKPPKKSQKRRPQKKKLRLGSPFSKRKSKPKKRSS
jgi:hypothetical protein